MSIIDLQGHKYASLIRDVSETCQISKIECFMNIVNSPQIVLIDFFSHAPTMLSTQTSKDKNTVLVYHSFPMKPCVVGFMSAIISTFIHEDSNVILVPYWRVDKCFQNVKHAITKMRYKSTSIMSVDCTPEPENETKLLCEKFDKFDRVQVFDHHLKRDNCPVELLIERDGFDYYFDPDKCAAKMRRNNI